MPLATSCLVREARCGGGVDGLKLTHTVRAQSEPACTRCTSEYLPACCCRRGGDVYHSPSLPSLSLSLSILSGPIPILSIPSHSIWAMGLPGCRFARGHSPSSWHVSAGVNEKLRPTALAVSPFPMASAPASAPS